MRRAKGRKRSLAVLCCLLGALALSLLAANESRAAFESGSTCGAAFYNSTTCRGAFNPTVNTVVQLPPNGILDYTTVTIPQGVTVAFGKNAANTPVIIRTSGNVVINGTIDASGSTAIDAGTAGDGNLGNDGQPGLGGPGGFDGGMGAASPLFGGALYQFGGAGKGPGGGYSGSTSCWTNVGGSGGGGSFGSAGDSYCGGGTGAVYGQASLLPLIGGSGGAGGGAGLSYNGAGGGGGGGAILIASSGTITIGNGNGGAGRIYANGGSGGNSGGSNCGGAGGAGSGGGIRLVADALVRNWDGYLQATPGTYGQTSNGCPGRGGQGGNGIIRLEANTITGWSTGNSNPAYTFGLPGHILVPNNPTLQIVSVTAGGSTLSVPANPTGNADLTFPTGTTTATVNLAATGIPSGSTATVYVMPATGAARTQALSNAFSVPDANGLLTASATVALSPGNNILQAAVTYTVTELVAMNLPRFNGEYVAKIRVEGGMDGKSRVTYITASGKEYPADGSVRKG